MVQNKSAKKHIFILILYDVIQYEIDLLFIMLDFLKNIQHSFDFKLSKVEKEVERLTKQSLYNFLGSYNKAYKSKSVDDKELLDFIASLKNFYEQTNSIDTKNEELLKDKFKECVLGNYQIFANENRIDLSIKKDGKTQVICEFKQPSNKNEMLQIGSDNINKKALQEAIWYFYNQDTKEISYQIKNVLITDTEQFFFFNPKHFCNSDLEKTCLQFRNNQVAYNDTKTLYKQIGDKIAQKEITFDYTEFDLLKYKNKILNDTLTDSDLRQLKYFYKALHPDFLLREFSPKDSNELNSKFYNELLYILGLKEVGKGQKLIQPSETKGTLRYRICSDLNHCSNFDDVINLIIIWLNRLLFLKLFESQLISFNDDNSFSFLNSEKISDFSKLNKLFFNILGKPIKDREDKNIPYLNSSLFERASLEEKYGNIANLDSETTLELYKGSVLSKVKNYPKNPPLLKYLLDFLESYNFSSNIADTTNNKEIINSSVLGLIFEKLNGYKDGSFFTPAYITEYMAQNAIDNLVIEKFNEAFKGEKAPCKTIEDLKNLLSYDKHIKDRKVFYNEIIDSIKICDPAVGSGHFLVSVLNYLIALKSELGLLDIQNKIEIQNDSLIIYEPDDETQFQYKRNNSNSLTVQKAIFDEKRKIIENCLFGVDINPNSVQICCLRLWIELLKNTYYIDNTQEMQILPNIDINIKCGNSLISGYKVEVGKCALDEIDGRTTEAKEIKEYKELVASYKNSDSKISKSELREKIKKIKHKLFLPIQLGLFEDRLKQGIYDNSMEWMIEFPELLDERGIFQGFDIVIGNPPYIDSETMTKSQLEARNYCSEKYSYAKGNWDIYIVFFERGYNLLKNKGSLIYITPDKWLTKPFGNELRINLINNFSKIIFCGRKVFDTAKIDSILTFITKNNVENIQTFKYENETVQKINEAPKTLLKTPYLLDCLFSESFDILTRIKQMPKRLKDFAICKNACATSDTYKLKPIIENNLTASINTQDDFFIINTGTIDKYISKWGIKEMTYLGNKYLYPKVNKNIFFENFKNSYSNKVLKPKIIIKGMTLLDACLDFTGNIIPAKSTLLIDDENIDLLKFICAILNSRLSIFYIKENYPAQSYNGGIGFTPDIINELPMPKDISKDLIALVDEILNHTSKEDYYTNKKALNKVKELQFLIDNEIFKLYGLDNEEIRIIEKEDRWKKNE